MSNRATIISGRRSGLRGEVINQTGNAVTIKTDGGPVVVVSGGDVKFDQSIDSYTNRQGNAVKVFRDHRGEVVTIEINGSGSNRAFQAQLRAARKRATVVGV